MARFECRILVVDDNRDHTDSTALMLHLMGHHVERAYDGENQSNLLSCLPRILFCSISPCLR
jgi:CheY-like chemotaxis protein